MSTKLTTTSVAAVANNGNGPAAQQVITPATTATIARIGIDLGNKNVKAARVVTKPKPRILTRAFESAFALPVDLNGRDTTGLTTRVKATLFTHITSDGESSFFVGEDARLGTLKSNVPANDNRITGLADLRLMLYTITVQFKVRAKPDAPPPQVFLYAGLPLHLEHRGREVARAWTGIHQVKINNRPYHIEVVGVKTASQPHGGLFDWFFLENGRLNGARKAYLQESFGIVDMGERTTDIVRLVYDPVTRKMIVDKEHTVGLSELGAQTFYRAVYRAIYDKYHRDVTDDVLVDAIKQRRLKDRVKGNIDITQIVEEASAQVVEMLAGAIVKKAGWTDEIISQTDHILAIGGTPLLLGKPLTTRLPYVDVPANAPVACAEGLAKAAITVKVF